MESYNIGAAKASKAVTETFSSSFSSAISLLDHSIRQDIYNIYGLVRIADEIVDTHQGENAQLLLDNLEAEVYDTLQTGFSTNVIVHSFCISATKYAIEQSLIEPFFASMRMDLTKQQSLTRQQYDTYIYGSAEVIGLMCLKVFVAGDRTLYKELKDGASALGAAYQKVNFLRDIKDDQSIRGRFYFPGYTYETFTDQAKTEVVEDIRKDFSLAKTAIDQLPPRARFATKLSYDYYTELLDILERMKTAELKSGRVSVGKWVKLQYLFRARIGQYAS